ncbi:UNVERIFIED_CONTAM: hypothetical protein Slati_2757300 [Sesamum latifolium]|uniref:Uncharacterized protein n=1 Tax=Sesamum latifolium TaxID=2727402 RepID=A0AAW2VXG9_9LAMI
MGEAEAEVRGASGQVESGVVEEKISEEELPQPMDDAAGPPKESQAQEKDAEVEEKTPSVW